MSRALSREMCFVLLGRDPASPWAIRRWADFRVDNGHNRWHDPQIDEARQCAEIMEHERDDIRREVAYERIARGEGSPPAIGLDLVPAMFLALGVEVGAINLANGWDVPGAETWAGPNPDKLPRLLCLVHSEVSEALEAFREGDLDNFGEEIADTVIRLVDIAHGIGIDLGGAILAKLEKNRARGERHGGKSC